MARLRRCTRLEGRGWFSLRSVGSAQAPELRPSGVDTSRRHLGAALAPRFCETNPNFHRVVLIGSDRAIRCYGDGDGFLNRVRLAKTDPISHWLGRIFCASGIVAGLYDDNTNGFVYHRLMASRLTRLRSALVVGDGRSSGKLIGRIAPYMPRCRRERYGVLLR